MTPELQAQHHSRISKRELAKEFDGLIEEMELDKMQLHLNCGGTAPKVVAAQRRPHDLCSSRDASGGGCAEQGAYQL